MFKKIIKFEDFDGNEVAEEFYFNISRAEMLELEASVGGGYGEVLKRIGESDDASEVIKEFKNIISLSVGRRSEDKRRFIKDEEARSAFFDSNAYDALLWELLTDPGLAIEFAEGVMPRDVLEAVEKGEELLPVQQKDSLEGVRPNPFKEWKDDEKDTRPAWVKEDRDPTQEELTSMTKDQLTEAFRQKNRRDREK